MHREGQAERHWLLALLALASTLTFLLLHPYKGMVHDARLYTIQALSHVKPNLYANDIFLRLGSQDDFTVYSSMHALAISWFGIEPAAAVAVAVAIALFLVATWMLARTILPTEQVAIATLLILLVPGYYGSARVFHHLEEFVTPRQLAEALTLFSLAAWIAHRKLHSVVLAIVAMLIHPIIGLSGVLLLPIYEWFLPHWRRLLPWTITLACVAAAIAGLGHLGWLPISQWQFDKIWLDIVMNRTYLGMENWTNEDWGRVVTVSATLTTASLLLQHEKQKLAIATLIVTASLMLLAAVGGEWLRLTLVVQAQPWRAMWLATVIGIILLVPLCSLGAKSSSKMVQSAVLLLVASWAAPHGILALVAAPLSVIASTCVHRQLPFRTLQMLFYGSCAILGIALLHSLAVTWLAWNENLTVVKRLPFFLQKVTLTGESGVLPAMIVALGWLLARKMGLSALKPMTLVVGVAIAATAYPVSRTWAAIDYGSDVHHALKDWRALIPEGSEVLWVDGGREMGAINAWLLLERPSYMSSTQAPNALFSRDAAIEMARRATAVSRVLPFDNPFDADDRVDHRGPYRLHDICSTVDVRYVITTVQLVDSKPISLPSTAPHFLRDNGLYICP